MESRIAIDDELAGSDVSPVAVIYGANASGKSTFIDALRFVRHLVETSAFSPVGSPINVPVFALSEDARKKPFRAKLIFTTAKFEYSYSFDILKGVITSEELLRINPNGKRRTVQTIFSRHVDDTKGDIIKTTSYMHGAKKHIVDTTRPNSLFLSKAAQENNKDILDAYEWFVPPKDDPTPDNEAPSQSIALFESDPAFQTWVLNLLQTSDLGVGNVEIRLPKNDPPKAYIAVYKALSENGNKQEEAAAVAETLKMMNRHPVLFHQGNDPTKLTPLGWNSESRGTIRMWELAGNIYSCLNKGLLLHIDELSSLHPVLVRRIVSIFQSKRSNPKNAQILFTTHDITLLGNYGGAGYALDRDQIWFTEKDAAGATSLYPLTDFDPKINANTEKMYIEGRFGAVPLVEDLP